MPTESELRIGLGVVQIERDLQRVIIDYLLGVVPIEERRKALDAMWAAAGKIMPVVRPVTLAEAEAIRDGVAKACVLQQVVLLPPLQEAPSPQPGEGGRS